jgi:hypothetical protein
MIKNKQDLAFLIKKAEEGVESEAYCLSSELYNIDDRLGRRFAELPAPSYLLQVAGMFEQLAKNIAHIKRLKSGNRR